MIGRYVRPPVRLRPGRFCQCLLAWWLIAFGLRLLVVFRYAASLQVDTDLYWGIAENLIAGQGYALPGTQAPTAFRPPVYPLLLAGLQFFGGGGQALGIVQAVLGATTAVVVGDTARRIGLGWRAQLATAILVFDPLLLYSTALVMTETLATFLAAVLLWLLVIATDCPAESAVGKWPLVASGSASGGAAAKCSPSRQRMMLLAVGGTWGLCCLCRPTFWVPGGIFLLGGLVYYVCGFCRKAVGNTAEARSAQGSAGRAIEGTTIDPGQGAEKSESIAARPATAAWGPVRTQPVRKWPGGWQPVFWSLLGLSLVVAPWGIRNALVFHTPLLTTTHGGYTLYLGHNPVYYAEVVEQPWGTQWGHDSLIGWQADLERRMGRELDRPQDERARDEWMYRQARREIAASPVMAFRSGLTLVGRLWNIVPLVGSGRPTAVRVAIGVGYGVLWLLLGWSIVQGIRRPGSIPPVLWGGFCLLVGFTAVHFWYWSDLRMRAPLMPAIALLAAWGLRWRNGDPVGNPDDRGSRRQPVT